MSIKILTRGNNIKSGILLLVKEEILVIINKVEICGVNTSKLPILKEKEKKQLLMRMKEGDKSARETCCSNDNRRNKKIFKR